MRNETIDETINATIAKQYTDWHIKHGGFARDMTMRDHFAGLAMQSMLLKSSAYEVIAQYAYRMADAMLKERNK
jgi:hypothetical protein